MTRGRRSSSDAWRAVPTSIGPRWRPRFGLWLLACSWPWALGAGRAAVHRLALVQGSRLHAGLHHAASALNGGLFLGLGRRPVRFLCANLSVRRAHRAARRAVGAGRSARAARPRRSRAARSGALLPVIAVIATRLAGCPRRAVHGTRCSSYLNASRSARTDPLFGRDLGFFVFDLPFWRLVYGWATALVAGTLLLTPARLRAAAKPRAHHPRPAAGRGRAHPPAGAGRAAPRCCRAVGFWLDRFELRLLAAGSRLRRVLHRRPRRRCPSSGGSPSSRCSAPAPASSRSAGRAGASSSAGLVMLALCLGRRPRRVSVAAPALPGHAQRARRRAPVHRSTTSG